MAMSSVVVMCSAGSLPRPRTTRTRPGRETLRQPIELVTARATMGEITARLREVFGHYVETPIF